VGASFQVGFLFLWESSFFFFSLGGSLPVERGGSEICAVDEPTGLLGWSVDFGTGWNAGNCWRLEPCWPLGQRGGSGDWYGSR
jgi:hypothetical protein